MKKRLKRRLKKRPQIDLAGDSRGLVLLMVLVMVSLFTVMVVEFASDQSMDVELAYNFHDSLQARILAQSGLEAALVMIKEDDPAYDGEDEDWGRFSEYALMAGAYLEGMSFSGSMVDESGKFDINSLVNAEGVHVDFREKQLRRLFNLLEIDIQPDELEDLLDAVKDWIDPDSETEFGAENDHYRSLEQPYFCKDGPLDTVEELLLIRGMKAEYLYGGEEKGGLIDYVTAGKGGKVNINTASEVVLMSLSELIGPDVAAAIIDGRPFKAEDEFLRIDGLDLSIQGESDEAREVKDLRDAMGVASDRFRVDVRGSMPSGAISNMRAMIERVEKKPRIVYYKIY